MLMQAVRGIFFFILVAISAVGLLVLLPFLKEGASREEIPLLLGGAGIYLLLGGVWWLFVGRVPVKAALGWAFLLAPLLAYLALAGVLLLAYVRGERLSRSISIESYSEEPIFWPGFDDPVGWRIVVGLNHPPEVC
jgi:high-affinity Fe2+/Pb2+ permease